MKTHVWMTVVAATLAVASVALAEPRGRGGADGDRGRGGPGGRGAAIGWLLHNEEAAREAGVTDEQLGQLKDAFYKARQSAIKLRAELDLARLELSRLMDEESPDEAALDKAVDQVSAIEAQLQKARIKEQLSVRAILGEETLAKVREQMQERMRGRRGDGQRRGGRGQGQGFQRGQGMCPMMPMPAPDAPEAPAPEGDDEPAD